jgi:hypothetical protein
MNIPDWIRTYLPKWVALPLTLLLAILGGMFFVDFYHVLPSETSKLLNPIGTLKVAVISLLLFFAMSFCYILLYRAFTGKPNLRHYELINPPGFMKNKETGRFYCHPCLFGKQTISPLSVISEKELKCRVCGESYKIDYSLLLNNSYLSIVQDDDPLFRDHQKAVDELMNKREPK